MDSTPESVIVLGDDDSEEEGNLSAPKKGLRRSRDLFAAEDRKNTIKSSLVIDAQKTLSGNLAAGRRSLGCANFATRRKPTLILSLSSRITFSQTILISRYCTRSLLSFWDITGSFDFILQEVASFVKSKPESAKAGAPSEPTLLDRFVKKESYPADHPNQLSLEKHVQKLLVCTLAPVQALSHPAFSELVRSIDPKLKVWSITIYWLIICFTWKLS